MIAGKGAGSAHGELAGILPGVGDEIVQRLEWAVGKDIERVRTPGRPEDGHEVVVVIGGLLEGRLHGDVRLIIEQQSVAVRFGGHEIIAAHHGSAAGLVVQNDFLPQQFFHSGEHDPDNAIRAGPCPKGQNHGDGAVGVGSGPGRRGGGQGKTEHEQRGSHESGQRGHDILLFEVVTGCRVVLETTLTAWGASAANFERRPPRRMAMRHEEAGSGSNVTRSGAFVRLRRPKVQACRPWIHAALLVWNTGCLCGNTCCRPAAGAEPQISRDATLPSLNHSAELQLDMISLP